MVAGRLKVALLAGASLFALPSEHENFGIAALEAVAAGAPVLLSPHVDLAPDLVKAGLGDAVPLEVSAWRDRLAACLTDRSVLARDPDFAREWVRERYSWKTIAAELDVQYTAVLGSLTGGEPGA
jgi:glycosyltransferase involved in cell wall biosynthesis